MSSDKFMGTTYSEWAEWQYGRTVKALLEAEAEVERLNKMVDEIRKEMAELEDRNRDLVRKLEEDFDKKKANWLVFGPE